MTKKAFIIAGPTASGKSEFAHLLSKKIHGSVVNIDSMQVYADLKILSASPNESEKENIPYYLYNFIKADEKHNLSLYLEDLSKALQTIEEKNSTPVIVGGTGLYIHSVINGLKIIPEINNDVKLEIEKKLNSEGLNSIYQELEKADPVRASQLSKNDSTRIIRSLEIIKSTGNSILDYNDNYSEPILKNYQINIIYLKPERNFLYENINNRFRGFLKNGAIEEVENFILKYKDINSSIKGTIGLNEIKNYLNKEISLEEAENLSAQKTRNYAKRQFTWFNNQLPQSAKIIEYSSRDEFNLICNDFLKNLNSSI